MKKNYQILKNKESYIVLNKIAPMYAAEIGRQDIPTLEKELYNEFKKQYYVIYPMDSWCTGITCISEQPHNTSLLNIIGQQQATFIYEIIVKNPIFFTEKTVEQKLLLRGRKYEIHPEGEKFQAIFKLLHKYKDYSYVEVTTHIPFHQGILVLSSFLGSPILGDQYYGLKQPLYLSTLKKRKYKPKKRDQEELPLIQRPAVHLKTVIVEKETWEAELPKDFRSVLANLKKYNSLAEESFLEGWLKDLQSDETTL